MGDRATDLNGSRASGLTGSGSGSPWPVEGVLKENRMALTGDRATEILLEERLADRGKPKTADQDDEEAEYRNRIREEVKALKKAGIIIEIPSD